MKRKIQSCLLLEMLLIRTGSWQEGAQTDVWSRRSLVLPGCLSISRAEPQQLTWALYLGQVQLIARPHLSEEKA